MLVEQVSKEEKATVLVTFEFHRNVVNILNELTKTGSYKTRVDVILSALSAYERFQDMWKKENIEK